MNDQPTTSQEPPKQENLKVQVFDQVVTLLLGGLGLVAALAWNEAILGLFKELFPQGGGLGYKFLYAIVVTVIIVIISVRLRKIKERADRQ
jgi:ABC-type sugar transport system permease subunit